MAVCASGGTAGQSEFLRKPTDTSATALKWVKCDGRTVSLAFAPPLSLSRPSQCAGESLGTALVVQLIGQQVNCRQVGHFQERNKTGSLSRDVVQGGNLSQVGIGREAHFL